MRRIISICLIALLMFSLVGCSNAQTVTITIPAKSAQSVVFSDTAFCAAKNKIKVQIEGTKEAELILSPENNTLTGFITQNATEYKWCKMDAKKNENFKIGIVSQNTTDSDVTVTLQIKNIEF